MRILGISLLRLGDLILQRPLVEALRRDHPESEIHLVINSQFSQVEFLFQGLVDRFIYFDRELFQKSCGDKEFNIFWGLEKFKSFIRDLNGMGYDCVYNFTHNRLSAHISGLIHTKKRTGIYSLNGQFFGLDNPWIQFFNSYFGKAEGMGFHYCELLARALEISVSERRTAFSKKTVRKGVLIQALTSDKKKNWSLSRFRELVSRIQEEMKQKVTVLGAEFEEETLLKYFDKEQLLICDIKTAFEHLQSAELLITGDTSVKHLAALAGTPILELSLGSSQPLQTGPYIDDAMILQPIVQCGPCPHSQNCNQASQLCAESLSVDAVFEAAGLCLKSSSDAWEQFTYRNRNIGVYRTEIHQKVGWVIESVSSNKKDFYQTLLQRKIMIVEELDRRQISRTKGDSNEQRTRKLPNGSLEAS